jgi:serine/threonine protein kinase
VVPVQRGLLADSDVEAARTGPSFDELARLCGDRPCDLGNIEVFYRLGLRHLAEKNYDMAIAMFDAVEETSPGYRDAERRALAVRAYRHDPEPPAVMPQASEPDLEPPPGPLPLELELPLDLPARAAPPLPPPPPSIAAMIRDGSITIVESLRVARQVLDGLEYAHNRKEVHGGVCPANLVRGESGAWEVCAGESAAPYRAPEQLRGEPLDGRCDLFALCVSMYEMLTGQLPYDGADRMATPAPLSELVPAVPLALEDLVMRGLAPRKQDRWSSAFVMSTRLEQLLAQISSGKKPDRF